MEGETAIPAACFKKRRRVWGGLFNGFMVRWDPNAGGCLGLDSVKSYQLWWSVAVLPDLPPINAWFVLVSNKSEAFVRARLREAFR